MEVTLKGQTEHGSDGSISFRDDVPGTDMIEVTVTGDPNDMSKTVWVNRIDLLRIVNVFRIDLT
jgi:hypothetical protein